MPASTDQRRSLRRQQRQQRRNLTEPQRSIAEQRVARSIVNHPWFIRARHVAFYMAFDSEVDVMAVAHAAQTYAKNLYLPQIGGIGRRAMRFVTADIGNANLRNNGFGIDEPATGLEIDPRQLDLVLTPLVAFDGSGTRLGMGGGYYDQTFSFLKSRQHWRHPKLLGVGFEMQRVDSLPREAWDVPLHGVVTEAVTLSFPMAGER